MKSFILGAAKRLGLYCRPRSRKTPRRVAIETLIYSIEQDQLIWAGESETTDPKDVRKFAEQLVDAIGKEMREAGLVRK